MAERDIGFLGVMGWGLMLAENSSAVAAAAVAAVTGPPGGGKVNIWLNNSILGRKKVGKKSFQNWACLVGKILLHPVGVFLSYLEAPSSHIVFFCCLLKIWYFSPSLLSADAGIIVYIYIYHLSPVPFRMPSHLIV